MLFLIMGRACMHMLLLRLLEQQQGDLEKYTNHVHSEVVRFCENSAPVEAAAVARGDAALLHGSWQFKADFTTYTAAISKFIAGLEAQLTAWEKQEDVFGADEVSARSAKAEGTKRTSRAEEEETARAEIPPAEDWQCHQCTYLNTHTMHARSCAVCGEPRHLLKYSRGGGLLEMP